MTSVSFGDKPAGAIASLALRKTAEINSSVSPRAARMITDNSYVDDICDSFDSESIAQEIAEKPMKF